MTMSKLNVTGSILLAVALLALAVSCSKQATHDNHAAHDHADHAAAPAPSGYAGAIKQIRTHMTSLNGIIASGSYKAVHNDAEAIVDICESMEKLAADPNSGVPRDKVSLVGQQAKELATASDAMHGAAHAGEVAKLKEHFAHMGRVVESLAQYVGRT